MSGAGRCYPMVPGHEIVGQVTAVGAEVKKFKVGDLRGGGRDGGLAAACARTARRTLEQYCTKGFVGTYNAKDYDGASYLWRLCEQHRVR